MNYIYDVVPSRPMMGNLSYFSQTKLSVGQKVKIPIGNSTCEGFIVSQKDEDSKFDLKEIEFAYSNEYFNNINLEFYKWVSNYYHYPLGEFLNTINPKFIPKRKIDFDKFISTSIKLEGPIHCLNTQQINAISSIDEKFCSLLHGVTGSGKTEVYIEYAKKIIKQNKAVLIIVPEISLTPGLMDRISKHFDGEISVIHSSISKKQRFINWMNIISGKSKLIIGARSAIFAPFQNLGFIVVDEEHESTYKQDDRLRYNARNLALVLAKMHKAKVVLSSATPSVETYFNAKQGKYKYISILSRIDSLKMPESKIIDLRKAKMISQNISFDIYEQLVINLQKQEQSILYINRRGYSNTVICKDCGYNFKCPNCDINLTEHKFKNKLLCHYCSFERSLPNYCLNCKSDKLSSCGSGTEKVLEEVKSLIPQARILRMDSDEVNTKDKLTDCLNLINSNKVDIIVGTQILGKGHDFNNLTFVGIINADTSLMIPDFRSSEKTFQSIVQVSGRAGRSKQGRVIVQTYMPEHYGIQTAINNDFDLFYSKELDIRKEVKYPPFSNISYIEISSKIYKKAHEYSCLCKDLLEAIISKTKILNIDLLGPAPMPVFIVNNRFRFHIMIKSKTKSELNILLNIFNKNIKKNKLLRLKLDLDS